MTRFQRATLNSVSKSTVRMALTLTLAAGAFSVLPGCTSDEIAATALVIGAVAIVSDDDASVEVRDHRHERRDRRDRDRFDRRDWDRQDFDRHEGPGRRGPRFAESAESLKAEGLVFATPKFVSPKFVSTDARVINLANNYEISHYAATYLVRAIVMAEAKDTTGVKELGLELTDFRNLYQGKKIADSKVQALGSKLRLNADETARLISDMSEDVQIEKSVRGL